MLSWLDEVLIPLITSMYEAVGFGLLLSTFTDKTAESPYGAVGLVALFSGFFVMMGFIWATIGE